MDFALWSAFKSTGQPIIWLYGRELMRQEKNIPGK